MRALQCLFRKQQLSKFVFLISIIMTNATFGFDQIKYRLFNCGTIGWCSYAGDNGFELALLNNLDIFTFGNIRIGAGLGSMYVISKNTSAGRKTTYNGHDILINEYSGTSINILPLTLSWGKPFGDDCFFVNLYAQGNLLNIGWLSWNRKLGWFNYSPDGTLYQYTSNVDETVTSDESIFWKSAEIGASLYGPFLPFMSLPLSYTSIHTGVIIADQRNPYLENNVSFFIRVCFSVTAFTQD